jgi:hypothetical protein
VSVAVEKWALVAMVPSGLVLLVGAAIDRDWLHVSMWAAVIAWAGLMLRRSGRRSAT